MDAKRLLQAACLALAVGLVLLGCSASVASQRAAGATNKDIVDTAVEAAGFKTLVKAATAADLVDVLKGPGPLTVFAPTDEAFAKLPDGTLESLLKPENKAKLQAILKLHVVAGDLPAAEVVALPKLDSVKGESLLVKVEGSAVRIDRAKVVTADVDASNGTIHVIDRVLLPKTIVETAKVAGTFDTLLAAARAAGLADALTAEDANLTLFAPTDKAFATLPSGTVEDLLKPRNKDRLAAILKYHVVAGQLLLGSRAPDTLQGGKLDLRPTGLRVNEATVALVDVRAANGVVHVIDRVLMPNLPEPTPERKAMALIELAIERGVPVFNAGKPAECAAIYEVAARSLLDGFSDVLSDKATDRLKTALDDIRKDHRPVTQAWTLRRALDDVYHSLR